MPYGEKKAAELVEFDAKVKHLRTKLSHRSIAYRLGCSATKVKAALKRLDEKEAQNGTSVTG